MRITSEVMVTRSLDRLGARLRAYERTQNELAAGRRILAASDDPAGARRAGSLRSSMAAREQELRNGTDATGWLEAADSQLQSVLDRLNRVRQLAVQGASETSAEQRRALAGEVDQITEEIVAIANTRHLGRPLFGGFGDGDAIDVTSEPWQVNGWSPTEGGDRVMRRISDTEQVRVNVTAGEWLGFGGGPGEDLISQLRGLSDDLRTGTSTDVSGRLAGLDGGRANVTDALGTIGAATNRVDSAANRTQDLLLTLRSELSSIEDVDLAQGIMELQVQQVAYEATLQALGRALPPSLVAFLR